MLTFILSTSDEDPPNSDSLSEELESLSEELALDSESESTVARLILPFFLDLLLLKRLDLLFFLIFGQLREL